MKIPGTSIFSQEKADLATLTQRVTFKSWDPSDIWSAWWQKDKKTKRQKDKETKRQETNSGNGKTP